MLPSIKTLKPFEKRAFQLLIFLLPTQLSLHFWPDWALIFGIRVDYLSPALYVTDILLIILLGLFFLERRKVNVKTPALILIVSLVIINLYVATRLEPAFYKWVKFFVFFGFSFLIVKVKEFDFGRWVAKPLKISLLLVSFIGIFQFFYQKSLGGIFYFLGERTFSSITPGISLSTMFGKQYLRSYSIFSHPNSLAGFLVVSLILLYFKNRKLTRFDLLVIGVSISSLLLTFSRAAILTGILILSLNFFENKRSIFTKRVKHYLLILGFSVSALMPVFAQSILKDVSPSRTVEKRAVLAKAAGEMVSQRPLFGVGLNNFVVLLPATSLKSEYSWDLQPVHNIFLLFFTEVGIVGLILLFLISKKLFQTNERFLVYSLLAIFFTGLVDHYWLTLHQNMLLIFLVAGLALRSADRGKKVVLN